MTLSKNATYCLLAIILMVSCRQPEAPNKAEQLLCEDENNSDEIMPVEIDEEMEAIFSNYSELEKSYASFEEVYNTAYPLPSINPENSSYSFYQLFSQIVARPFRQPEHAYMVLYSDYEDYTYAGDEVGFFNEYAFYLYHFQNQNGVMFQDERKELYKIFEVLHYFFFQYFHPGSGGEWSRILARTPAYCEYAMSDLSSSTCLLEGFGNNDQRKDKFIDELKGLINEHDWHGKRDNIEPEYFRQLDSYIEQLDSLITNPFLLHAAIDRSYHYKEDF